MNILKRCLNFYIFKLLLTCSILILIITPLFAIDEPLDIFKKANQSYEKKDFSYAIELYESLLNSGYANFELYYNLGNSYYKNGQPGKALLNYERALRLKPRDLDLRYNIKFLRKVVQEPEPSFEIQIIQWFNNLLNINELTLLVSFLYIICTFLFIYYVIKKNRIFLWLGIMIFLIFLFMGGWLLLKINYETKGLQAILISGPAEVRNGPSDTDSVSFTLPEGRKLIILGENGDWYAIGLPIEGLKGWIQKRFIEKI